MYLNIIFDEVYGIFLAQLEVLFYLEWGRFGVIGVGLLGSHFLKSARAQSGGIVCEM